MLSPSPTSYGIKVRTLFVSFYHHLPPPPNYGFHRPDIIRSTRPKPTRHFRAFFFVFFFTKKKYGSKVKTIPSLKISHTFLARTCDENALPHRLSRRISTGV